MAMTPTNSLPAAMEFLDIILLTFVRHADALGLLDTVTHIYFASPNLRAGYR